MSKIIPKLNLNKTPQQVENNSLIFAKNVKLLSDGTIGPDVSLQEVDSNIINDTIKGYIGHVVGLDNIVYIFKQEPDEDAKIYKYSEDDNILEELHTGWKYNGGKIDGFVTTNNTNQIILTICEYDAKNNINVPIKHINLSECSDNDDESLYTQAPNIPFTNLLFNGRYTCTIPNGVYQFFVRYKIREDFYTPWIPCSGEIYAGTSQEEVTIQGSLKHIDINYDSPQSFKFRVEHLFDTHTTHYTEYQIGFILSNNDSVVARSWKSFNFDVEYINFDYDKFVIKEIDIDDLIKTNFELFNVKNITYYRNKEYISNYKETDFNPEINVDDISVELNTKFIDTTEVVSIENRNLNDNIEIEGIDVFSKWGNSHINVLLNNTNLININRITNEEKQNYTCNIGEAGLLWDVLDDSVCRDSNDIYYIVGWREKSTLNGIKHCGDFYTPMLVTVLNYIEDDYIGVSFDGGSDYRTKLFDRTTNPIGNTPNMKHKWYWRGGSYNENWDDYPGHGFSTFWSYPYFPPREISTAETYWKNTIKTNIQNHYGRTIIYKLEVNDEIIWGSDLEENADGTNFTGITITYDTIATDNDIKTKVLSLLKESVTGLGENGLFYINNDVLRTLKVYYVNIDFNNPELNVEENSNSKIKKILKFDAKVKPFVSEYNINIKSVNIKVENTQVESKTLMPYTRYNFYIHFIKQNGITTNGYKIGEGFYNGYTEGNDLQIIYPKIIFGDNFIFPKGYVSWFVSIYKAENEVCRGFNHYIKDGYHYMDCIECDALLYNLTKNIQIYENTSNSFNHVSSDGEYFASGNSTVLELFGNAGIVRWPVNGNEASLNSFVELDKTIDIPITTNDTIYLGVSIYDNRETANAPIQTSNYKSIDLVNLGTTNLKDHIVSEMDNFINTLGNYSKYVSYSVKYVPSAAYATLGNITGKSFDEFVSGISLNNFYGYQKNESGIITGFIELNDTNSEIIDIDKITENTTTPTYIINKKGDKFSYDRTNIFRAIDYIDKIVLTLKSNIIDNYNPIQTLDCVYKPNNALKNIITNNIKSVSINSAFVAVKSNDGFTSWNGWLDYIKRNPTVAKTSNQSYWVVIPTNSNTVEDKQLIKITPYLHKDTRYYEDYEQMNLPGFLCGIKKLNHIINDAIYVNGTDVYDKQYDNDCIILNHINDYVHNNISSYFYLPSNYNLNCLSLKEHLNVSLRNYIQEETRTDVDTGESEVIERTFIQTFKSVNSLVCSSIYELKSMYKDYIRKTYNVKSTKPINVVFENTIRSSDTNTDEIYRNIYRFEAEDYYNVPANRGIISYLFTTLDTIFVHTKHALYKFSGKNSLSSLDGDINLKQNEVFDSGITTILDSTNGFAGLTEKHHGLVTSKAYIFYDKQINTVFAFAEQGGIVNISEPINKLLTYHTPIDVKLVSDETNDRFYICFSLKNGHHLTLTYNFKVASFVSIHDLSYICGFSTRTNTYLIYKDENTWTMYKSVPSIVTDDKTYYIQYNKCYSLSMATTSDNINNDVEKGIPEASIDVLYNLNYESIKSLDWINWIISKIIKFDEGNYVAEEDLDREYSGYKIRIYSDSCATELIETSNQQNEYRMYLRGTDEQYPSTVNPSAYLEGQQYIRYNNGIWSMNYFRNIKNRFDIHKYNENTPLPNARHLYQEDSLVYGKYFVFRIIFTNDNFKFENITFNVKNYEKI